MNKHDLQQLHYYSYRNMKIFSESSDGLRCFHCLEAFTRDKIESTTDDGETARCPHCDIDSVIFDPGSLEAEEMQKYWFGGGDE